MRSIRFLLPLIALLPTLAAAEDAEWIARGGTIYTFASDDGGPVPAIAGVGDRILAVGPVDALKMHVGAQTRWIDLKGATLLPGLVDAHAHLFNLGRLLEWADLRDTRSAAECVELAQAHASQLEPGEWLKGRSWDQNDWSVQEFPDAALLDAAFGDRPVYLRRVDGHAAWVNSAAMRAANITDATGDPEGGEIVRDPQTGAATGIFIDAAEDLIKSAIPEETPAQLDRIIAAAVQDARSKGLVGVHEMGVDSAELAALRRLDAAGALDIRVVTYLQGDDTLAEFEGGPLRPSPSARLRIEGVKLYADGALGSRGAALLADYSDRPGHRGLMQFSEKELARQGKNAMARGFAVAIHAIGDRGNRAALDALIEAHRLASADDPNLPALAQMRCRIEHAQVVALPDIPRFQENGILPGFQPTHCTSDMPWAPERLGPNRLQGAYAWRRFRDTGTILPLGSDFPVELVSPLYGLHAAITRQRPDGTPPKGWSPDQRLSPEEAVLGFSAWAARACGVSEWGRLIPGNQADITILTVDPLRSEPAEILRAEVVATAVGGDWRWRE